MAIALTVCSHSSCWLSLEARYLSKPIGQESKLRELQPLENVNDVVERYLEVIADVTTLNYEDITTY